MKVIDARSGEHLTPGVPVAWGDGEWIRLDRVMPGAKILHAQAIITTKERNRHGVMLQRTRQIDLQVRWFHPRFLFKRVAFVPS